MKKFKSLEEQIELLKQRGLIIHDEDRAKKFLLSQNYYNIINGYAKFFPRDGEHYIANTSFDEITSLYIFERDLKQALLLAILEAETHLRSIVSYRFAEMYPDDPYAYLNIKCYDKSQILKSINTITNLSKTINKKSKSPGSSIAHYVKKYKHVPIWVLVNYINLGDLRYLIQYTTKPLQNKISKDLCEFIKQNIQDCTEPFHPETLNDFLNNLNDIRNICAHNNRLIGFHCHQNLKYWKPLHTKYNIDINDDRRSVYSVFITLQCFISKDEYAILHNTFRKRLRTLSNKLVTISINDVLTKLGFPENWHIDTNKLEQS